MSKKNAKQVKKNETKATKKNAKNVVAKVEVAETKTADRKAYAKEYYAKNAEKIREASRKCHAKRNAEKREAVKMLGVIYTAICGLVSETGADEFDRFYRGGGEKMMADFDTAMTALGNNK